MTAFGCSGIVVLLGCLERGRVSGRVADARCFQPTPGRKRLDAGNPDKFWQESASRSVQEVPGHMHMKLELVAVPVTDVDRAKDFYVDKVGFNADHDYQVSDELRFVQLTPPGSACSIVIGTGITEMAPGTQTGLQVVVEDVEAIRSELTGR